MDPNRHEFLMSLREGDVVRLNGRLRVIRHATEPKVYMGRGRSGPAKRHFYFAILRCSWTHRPYTCMSSTSLGNLKTNIELVARNYRPRQQIEAILSQDCKAAGGKSKLDCCQIKGIS